MISYRMVLEVIDVIAEDFFHQARWVTAEERHSGGEVVEMLFMNMTGEHVGGGEAPRPNVGSEATVAQTKQTLRTRTDDGIYVGTGVWKAMLEI